MSNQPTIPNFSYPFKKIKDLEECFSHLEQVEAGNYLFNAQGLWHGGVHFYDAALNGAEGDTKPIVCIADGELVAYRLDAELIEDNEGVKYSSGFFLVRHTLEYPIANKLTLFSLYMHTAPKSSYDFQTQASTILTSQSPTDSIEILSSAVPVKAGDILGMVGEYNTPSSTHRKVLHLELFSGDDIQAFSQKAQEAYQEANATQTLSPTSLIIPSGTLLYTQETHEVYKVIESVTHTNLRKAYAQSEEGYNFIYEATKGTLLEIDENTLSHGRYKVLKIADADVSSQNYTVHKDYITPTSYETYIPSQSITNKERLLPIEKTKPRYKDREAKEYFKLDEYHIALEETTPNHGITFKWAKIFDTQSSDDASIFTNFLEYFKEEIIPQELKLSPLHKELFEAIDKDHNGMLEYPLEIKNAAKDKDIKKLTSHYIVQHASEWGDTLQAFWNQMQTHLDTKVQQAQTEEAKEQHQTNAEHMRNQRARAQKLKFFSECSSIQNFPSSDIVYFLHPIRAIGEIKNSCGEDCETIDFMLSNSKYYKVSKQTMEFILSYEGFKSKPYVPKDKYDNVLGISGITIGYGYDLGQQTKEQISNDLNGFYTLEEIKSFQSVAGLKRNDAVCNLYKVENLSMSKDIAMQLTRRVKANYAQQTYDIWPEVIELHPHCQGALLSIEYNRGSSLNGDSRKEMKNIQVHLKNNEYSKIPNEIKAMKRLWDIETARGLHLRRDGEADFFQKGLNCECN